MSRTRSLAVLSLAAFGLLAILAGPAGAGLLGQWTFDGSTIDDSSGNGYNGALVGGAYSSDTPTGTGMSLDLSGGDNYAHIPGTGPGAFNLTSTMTVSTWVKGWPADAWAAFVSKNGEGSYGYQLRKYGTDPNVGWTTRVPSNQDQSSNYNLASDGRWHQIAGTYDGAYKRIYIDGMLINQVACTGSLNTPTGEEVVIGARQVSGGAIQGFSRVKLDDVRIYDNAQSGAQIKAQFVAAGGYSEDFESSAGRLDTQNWYVSSGSNSMRLRGNVGMTPDGSWQIFSYDNNNTDATNPAGGVTRTVYGIQGGGDGPTAVAWGQAFRVVDPTASLNFKLVGGSYNIDPNPALRQQNGGTGVALWDLDANDYVRDGGVIRFTYPASNGAAAYRSIALTGLAGHNVMPMVIDRSRAGYGWVGVDSISAPIGSVTSVPTNAMVYLDYGWDNAGDWQGWRQVDGAGNTVATTTFTIGRSGDGSLLAQHINLKGVFTPGEGFITSALVGSYDAPQGFLRSPNFTVRGDILEFYLAGGTDPNLGFELWADMDGTGTYTLQRSTRHQSTDATMDYDFWTIGNLTGKDAYLQLRDQTGGGWAWLAVDGVRMVGFEIPEPATMALLGLAVTGLGGYLRRRHAAARS